LGLTVVSALVVTVLAALVATPSFESRPPSSGMRGTGFVSGTATTDAGALHSSRDGAGTSGWPSAPYALGSSADHPEVSK